MTVENFLERRMICKCQLFRCKIYKFLFICGLHALVWSGTGSFDMEGSRAVLFQMLRCLWMVLFLLHSVISQTTDKYSDEDRPYKFGFNIQGYQHRQEEKDEKGLIKGEYGFITADGYYRVTVYATDENGDFRIISMKNYYVGFPPEDPTTTPGSPTNRGASPRQPQSFGRAPGATGRALGDDSTPKTPKAFTRPQGIAACSDCSIPTTTVRTNQPNLLVDTGEFRSGRTGGGGFGSTFNQGAGGRSSQFPQPPGGSVQTPGSQAPQSPQTPTRGQFPQTPTGGQFPQGPTGGQLSQGPTGGQSPQSPRSRLPGSTTSDSPDRPGTSFRGGSNTAGFKPGEGVFGSPRGRTDFTQSNQLDDTPNRRPQIGQVREGLPPGVTLNDIKDLLYTFNYTVGFHGHHEDGYRNGDKQGDYFFDGRDGVERKVEYLANEFGYQPNITLIDLPENDVRRPNEQTEKEYGLKGYEFKWFYRK